MRYPSSIQNLIQELTKLPTVGPKTAERFVFYLLQQSNDDLKKFGQAVAELKDKTTVCGTCFAVADSNPCEICSNTNRKQDTIMIVSNTRDMISIESTGEYKGLYHVLGGVINVIEGVKPENLKVSPLLARIKHHNTQEIILALNPNLEGETTSMYLSKHLTKHFPEIIITKLAKGLQMGSDLEYADELTLLNALKYRNKI